MTALSSLIHALYEMDMAGVVRYVFRKNANPRLCALVPHIKPDNEVGGVTNLFDLFEVPFLCLDSVCTCISYHSWRTFDSTCFHL